MFILGIDPGNSGSMVLLSGGTSDEPRIVEFCKFSNTEREIVDFLSEHPSLQERIGGKPVFAYIEKVHASPGAGVSGMFKFGQSFGFLRGVLTALKIPFDEVQPLRWQRAMQCARPQGMPKESQTAHKNRTKARAQQLFPEIKVTHALADALLLAEFGRRLRAGELK